MHVHSYANIDALVWNAPTCDRCGHPEVDIFQVEGVLLLMLDREDRALSYALEGDMFDKDKVEKSHYPTDVYAALGLGQRTIQAVLIRQDGKIVNELKIKKQADRISSLSLYSNIMRILFSQ